jgi:hypothetical protein
VLGSISIRLGLGSGPGIGGLIAEYSNAPLRLPFELHLIALAAAALTLRLEVLAAERAVF